MPHFAHTIDGQVFAFRDLKDLMAKATPARSGDALAGIAAENDETRVAAQMALANLPLKTFLNDAVIPYEADEVTRLILDTHDANAFAPVSHLTVGDLRNWLLSEAADTATLTALAPGLTPEMVAAVSKIMRLQDLIVVAKKCSVVTRFRNTIGLPGRMSTRLQPNHPTDDPTGIAASIVDGLMYANGDAVIGINPATDSIAAVMTLIEMLDAVIRKYEIPTQSCVLAHVTTSIEAIRRGAPLDLVFQSIAGTEAANRSFGVNLAVLQEGYEAALSLKRGTIGHNVMYFETGQGSALSANAHHGVDQQTCEARAYAVARRYQPLLVNTVVGFIGPEYLYDGKQIIRAGLEDHFCGKLLGVPMGCDVCYTNHAEADQNDMDVLLTLLAVAGINFVMGIPGSDDIMLNYQTTSFHDAMYVRQVLGLRPAPEFEAWLDAVGVFTPGGALRLSTEVPQPIQRALTMLGRGAERTMSDSASAPVTLNPWDRLRQFTQARIALGRAGNSLPTDPHLAFQFAHARARDAVHHPLDTPALCQQMEARGLPVTVLHSAAADRATYLQRPDLGRTLDATSRQLLGICKAQLHTEVDLVIVIADGLSAFAIEQNVAPFLDALLPQLAAGDWKLAPLVIVEQGRVAVGDEVAHALSAPLVALLVGERPGLSSPDSMGIYLTWQPLHQPTDADRNCISNVRREGMSYAVAVHKLMYLMNEARRRSYSGVALKDEAEAPAGQLIGPATRNFLTIDEH